MLENLTWTLFWFEYFPCLIIDSFESLVWRLIMLGDLFLLIGPDGLMSLDTKFYDFSSL